MQRTAYTYILASRRRGTLYTGVTNNLTRRIHQHQTHAISGFTEKYGMTRLVWYVEGDSIIAAIELEKKIKNRGRDWKIRLIESSNPRWEDLAASWE